MKYFGGCDSGSTYTKCVILDENGKIAADVTLRSRINSVLSAQDALEQAIAKVPELNDAKDLAYLVGLDRVELAGNGGRHLLCRRVDLGGDAVGVE